MEKLTKKERVYWSKENKLPYIDLSSFDGVDLVVLQSLIKDIDTKVKALGYTKVTFDIDNNYEDGVDITIEGERLETDDEFFKRKNRLELEKIRREKAKIDKEKADKALYYRLKAKFGKGKK